MGSTWMGLSSDWEDGGEVFGGFGLDGAVFGGSDWEDGGEVFGGFDLDGAVFGGSDLEDRGASFNSEVF